MFKRFELYKKGRLEQLLKNDVEISDKEQQELNMMILELETKIKNLENNDTKDFDKLEKIQRILSALTTVGSGIAALITKSPELISLTMLGTGGVASADSINNIFTKIFRKLRISKMKNLIDIIK